MIAPAYRATGTFFIFLAVFTAPSAGAQVAHDAWFPGSSSISEPEVIPPAFRGRWAPNRSACLDQDGVDRVVVLPNGMDTYESGARLERVTQAGQERSIKLKFSYEGEGGFWDRIEIWTLNAGGDQVTMTDEDGSNPSILVRCN